MPWIIYSFCTVVILAVCSYLLRKFLPRWLLLAIVLLLLVVLLTPAAVPGTEQLAPAVLASVYEFLFGEPAVAGQLLKPVLWASTALLALLFVGGLLRYRLHQKHAKSNSDGQTVQ